VRFSKLASAGSAAHGLVPVDIYIDSETIFRAGHAGGPARGNLRTNPPVPTGGKEHRP